MRPPLSLDTFQPTGPALSRRALPFSRWRNIGFAVSAALIILTVALVSMRGLELGLDFTGGILVEARRETPFDLAALRQALEVRGLSDAVIQLDDEGRSAMVRVAVEPGQDAQAVAAAFGEGAQVVNSETVGPKVSRDLLTSGLSACLAAVGAIAIYIWLRFEVRFAMAAFATTFHDVAMMLGFYALTGITFDLSCVAAMLLIAGYSINDTVVVFDRLREILHRKGLTLPEVIDTAITSTLRRTVMTSATTIATALALLVFGGPVLFGFAAGVTFGLVLGTLSSIFVAAPLLLVLPGRLVAEPLAGDRERS